ncbi:MAG: kinase/pyrophosphorylase, partial [Gemmatimonadota bacterium]
MGHSLLTQFHGVEFRTYRLPFVDNEDKARKAAIRIRAAGEQSGTRPIVVNTVVDSALSAVLAESGALMLDVFAPFIAPIEH